LVNGIVTASEVWNFRLSASRLTVGNRNHQIGSGVDLALTAGEALVLPGQNGAGKITPFRTLPGLNPAEAP
jgi:ABC-type transport system involved in cytochrome c biogenesis ATPase subunit